MPPKVITMTLFNRPAYTKQCLQALSECVGISEYILCPTVEPGCQEVIDLVKNVRFAEVQLEVNADKLGCNKNIWKALDRGFKQAAFVIHVEDDVLLAPDALRFFEFCSKRYKDDPSIHTIGAFHREVCKPDQMHSFFIRQAFICWAWGTWKDRWEEPLGLRECWDLEHKNLGWDHHIHRTLRKNRGQVTCNLSRAQNIGAENGVYTPSAEWHKENVLLECWAGNPEYRQAVVEKINAWGTYG